MTYRQVFIVIETEGTFAVHSISQFPKEGVWIGENDRRLRVVGNEPVSPPKLHLSGPEFDQWCRELEASGREVTIGPFWSDPGMLRRSRADIERGETISLKEAFDELLRRAEERERAQDHGMEAVEPSAP